MAIYFTVQQQITTKQSACICQYEITKYTNRQTERQTDRQTERNKLTGVQQSTLWNESSPPAVALVLTLALQSPSLISQASVFNAISLILCTNNAGNSSDAGKLHLNQTTFGLFTLYKFQDGAVCTGSTVVELCKPSNLLLEYSTITRTPSFK